MVQYLVTLQVADKKGLVEQIAHIVTHHKGNWLDSELHHLNGLFAAILLLEAPEENWDSLIENLEAIEGLSLTYGKTNQNTQPVTTHAFSLVAYDRPGLVHEISNKINTLGINIERLSTKYESASHTGVALFRSDFNLAIKDENQVQKLTESLYAIGDDVVLDKL